MPEPVLDTIVLEALRRDDSPTLSNAIETFDVRPRDTGFASQDVRCTFPDLGVMVGYAATAVIRARGKATGDPEPLWAHVQTVPAPASWSSKISTTRRLTARCGAR